MVKIYVAGNITTRSLPVAGSAVTLGRFVDVTSDGVNFQLPVANSSNVAGLAYAGDYKGKYVSGTGGAGIGSANTQSSVSSSNNLTIIALGSGAIVRGVTGATNINAGTPLKVDANGAVVAMVTASIDSTAGWNEIVGKSVTQQNTSGGSIDILLM